MNNNMALWWIVVTTSLCVGMVLGFLYDAQRLQQERNPFPAGYGRRSVHF